MKEKYPLWNKALFLGEFQRPFLLLKLFNFLWLLLWDLIKIKRNLVMTEIQIITSVGKRWGKMRVHECLTQLVAVCEILVW